MPKLLMLRGLPGSGKSTFAKDLVDKEQYVRVNKDDLRAMLDNGKHSKFKEEFVLEIRDNIIREALEQGRNIVVDDTNIHPKHEQQLKKLAHDSLEIANVTFEIKEFFDVPVETCIERDLKRTNSVGSKVIYRMLKEAKENYPDRFPKEEVEKYVDNPNLPNCVICDLDGTLAILNGRNPYDASTCEQDNINESVKRTIHMYWRENYTIIFMSGRSDKYREQTQRWLNKYHFNEVPLFMRSEGDNRRDCEVKKELFDKYIKDKYNVTLVLDDRNQVVELWRSLGLTCWQVAPGDF